jgi:hypothetical protein
MEGAAQTEAYHPEHDEGDRNQSQRRGRLVEKIDADNRHSGDTAAGSDDVGGACGNGFDRNAQTRDARDQKKHHDDRGP